MRYKESMNEETLYRCAVVECKTSGCGMLLVLEIIGRVAPPPSHVQLDILKRCREFSEVCPECRQAHTYGRMDVQVKHLPNTAPARTQRQKAHQRSRCVLNFKTTRIVVLPDRDQQAFKFGKCWLLRPPIVKTRKHFCSAPERGTTEDSPVGTSSARPRGHRCESRLADLATPIGPPCSKTNW